MIIAKLQGGLGNQLFQYCFSRSLAIENNTELKLDINWYKNIPDRQYDLGFYTIEASIAKPAEIVRLKGVVPKTLRRILKLGDGRHTLVEHSPHQLVEHALTTGDNTYVDGYWQSPTYFKKHANELRKELQPKLEAKGKNAIILKEILACNAISIHVRRGDYVSNEVANKYHGTCSIDYYERAVAIIEKQVKHPHFFVFSDDPEWTKANLTFDSPTTYVVGNQHMAQEDLRLMSSCKHHIIANSTFSWWGAWLGETKGQIVIAPKNWFQGGAGSDHLLPAKWMQI